jgi:23S rRNA (uracil1939-C5)-methyltransferase
VRASVEGDRGELVAVLSASPERVAPPCPHFGACGGCSFQHWSLDGQLAWKSEQVRLALAREGLDTDIRPVIATAPGTRRRVALHARPAGTGRRGWGSRGGAPGP